MPENPTLYVCHGDTGGPKFHPCRRVQDAMNASGIEYDKVVAAHGNPIPFMRKGSRDELRAATGDDKLPTLNARRDRAHAFARDPGLDRRAVARRDADRADARGLSGVDRQHGLAVDAAVHQRLDRLAGPLPRQLQSDLRIELARGDQLREPAKIRAARAGVLDL